MKANHAKGPESGRDTPEGTTVVSQNDKDPNYTLFVEGNVPPEHYETVKLWVDKLIKETFQFSQSLGKKIKRNKESKLFHAEYFKLADINNVLLNFYQIIDASVVGLEELRTNIEDYIKRWKEALANDSHEDDSSIPDEVVKIEVDNENFIPKRKEKVEEILKSKEDEAESNHSGEANEETTEEIKSEKTEENLPRIRVRNIADLIKPGCEPSNKVDGSVNSKTSPVKNIEDSSDDEVVLVKEIKPAEKSQLPGRKTKEFIETMRDKISEALTTKNDLKSSKSKMENKTSKTNDSKVIDVVDIDDNSSDDSVCVISDHERPLRKEEPEKDKSEEKSKFTINWDTSSSGSSERDWLMTTKKREDKSKNKKLKSRKERDQLKNKSSDSSSSEQDKTKNKENRAPSSEEAVNKTKKKNTSGPSSSEEEDKSKKKKKSGSSSSDQDNSKSKKGDLRKDKMLEENNRLFSSSEEDVGKLENDSKLLSSEEDAKKKSKKKNSNGSSAEEDTKRKSKEKGSQSSSAEDSKKNNQNSKKKKKKGPTSDDDIENNNAHRSSISPSGPFHMPETPEGTGEPLLSITLKTRERLCNLKALKRRRRSNSSSNSSSSSRSKKSAKKALKRSKKSKKEEISLLDMVRSSNESDSEVDSEFDFTFSFVDHLKSLPRNNKTSNKHVIEDLNTLMPDSDGGLEVLTDSSLDSIVEKLAAKSSVKIIRGSKKSHLNFKEKDKSADCDSLVEEKDHKKKSSRRRFRDKLLDAKLTDTDTTEGEEKWEKYKMKTRIESSDSDGEKKEDSAVTPIKKENDQKKRKTRNAPKNKKSLFSDDSDVANLSDSDSNYDEDKVKSDEDDPEDKPEDDETDEENKKENKRKRKRIQRLSDSSDDGEPTPSKSADGKGRRNIRKVLKEESLEKTTKEALKEEEERKRRIAEKQRLYNDLLRKAADDVKESRGIEEAKQLEELILDFDVDTKEPLVSVDKTLVKKLKPHQAEGIKFMWDSCFESVKDSNEKKGSGCILAHCMGLGKTLQVITLVHTLLTSEKVDVNRVLVVAPFSTVQNWVNEFKKWLKDVGSGEDFEIYDMLKTAVSYRSYQLRDWERTGGVMILGYNLFRTLVSPKGRMKASLKKAVQEVLLDPGPDVVVCDEGHILKNEKTAVNIAMSKLKTRRRIVLTGTPLQNNLIEYHCMVQFVKPNLLGTRKEFQNRFVHPIQNGQFEDSTAHDVKVMKRRAHVLHKMLDGIVQRKDYNVLTPYLPPKYEYVMHLKLTEVQCKLYSHYLDNFARKSKNEGGGLFQDFQHLLRICTHPRSLLIHSDKEILKRELIEDDSEGSLKDFIDDDSDADDSSARSSSSKSSAGSGSEVERSKTPPKKKATRAARAAGQVSSDEEDVGPPKRTEWWAEMVTEEELTDIKSSSKLFLFFTILKHCEEIGDKLLVFSQSLYTLDLIEHFLELVDENARKKDEEKNESLSQFSSNWDKGVDYFRLDGGTSSDNRSLWCKVFNDTSNTRGRLFLISTRAGGLGINLTGANRVIIFDASWNPSYDVQSIFRVYRFGQTKPCFIYRFLSKGTMEEKIYERQVAKLSTSLRVIDEQQIDRHFTATSLAELYVFNPDTPEGRETPSLPKDRLMAELLQGHSEIILKHHQHDSLLENQEDEELNEEERKAAWTDFENEKNNVPQVNYYQGPIPNQLGFGNQNLSFNLQAQFIIESLSQKIKAQNPTLKEDVVKQRAFQVLQTMPLWQNQQRQLYMQQQYYQQQMLQQQQQQQQQQLLMGQQSQLAKLLTHTSLPQVQINVPAINGSQTAPIAQPGTSAPIDKSKTGGPSHPIEIQDD